MKKFSLFVLAAVGLLMTACSTSEATDENPSVVQKDGGYMSVNIQLPTVPLTRAANDNYDDGDPSEYKVTNAVLLLFEGGTAADGSDATFKGSYPLTLKTVVEDVDKDNLTSSYPATAQITGAIPSSLWALVLINYNGIFNQATNTLGGTALEVGTSTIKTLQAITTEASFIPSAAKTDGFFMTNAVLSEAPGTGTAPTKSDLRILSKLDPEKVFETAELALKNGNSAGSVFVERGVAKATLSCSATQVVLPSGSFDISKVEWALNNVEPTSFVVRNMFDEDGNGVDEIADYMGYSSAAFSTPNYRMAGTVKIGETSIQPTVGLYRTYWCVDPHYTKDLGATLTAASYGSTSGALYCYENTFNVAKQLYKNTTRAVVKVTLSSTSDFYTINGANAISTIEAAKASLINQLILNADVQKAFKDSWTGGTPYTFDLKSEYLDVTLTTTAGKCTAETNSLVTTSAFASSADYSKFNATTLASKLAACTAAVTAANDGVDILLYKGGEMYYEVRFQHFSDLNDGGYTSGTFTTDLAPWHYGESPAPTESDAYPGSDAEKNYLGRWGMVRNNWYDLGITAIKSLGEPTDISTTISDGDNPDDNLTTKKYLSVKINILSWAKRVQSWIF